MGDPLTAAPTTAVEVVCLICNSTVRHKSCTIICTCCAKTVNVSCLTDQYKQSISSAVACKNSLDWVKGFIEFTGLRYVCSACKLSDSAGISNISSAAKISPSEVKFSTSMELTINNLVARVEEISNKISVLNTLPISATTTAADASQPKATSPSPPSYADIVSSDIVKQAVSQAFKDQRKAAAEDCSVIIFGLEESTNDADKVRDLLQCDDYSDYIIQVHRIGKANLSRDSTTKTKKCRPIKVQLKSTSDRLWVLQNSRWLVQSAKLPSVRIIKCLSPSELNDLRGKRSECALLNQGCKPCPDGKARYVVIN